MNHFHPSLAIGIQATHADVIVHIHRHKHINHVLQYHLLFPEATSLTMANGRSSDSSSTKPPFPRKKVFPSGSS